MSDVEIISDPESGGGAAPDELFVPAKSKSEIWKYFKLKKHDKTLAVCQKCPNKSLVFPVFPTASVVAAVDQVVDL